MNLSYLIMAVRLNSIFNRLAKASITDKKRAIYIIRKTISHLVHEKILINQKDYNYIIYNLTVLMYKIQQNDNTAMEHLMSLSPCFFQKDGDEFPYIVMDMTKEVFTC